MKKSMFSSLILGLSISAFGQTIAPMTPMDGYVTDNISKNTASNIFKNLKNEYKSKSTCSNRAMIWSYETYNQYKVNSEKYFIHYTDVFNHVIHNEGKHPSGCFFGWCLDGGKLKGWEYHVASAFMVNNELTIFDKYFLPNSPVTPEAWEKRFLKEGEKLLNTKAEKILKKLRKNLKKERLDKKDKQLSLDAIKLIQASKDENGVYHINCKRIENIADHDLDQRKSWCHTQRASMYYWNQNDLRSLNNGSDNIITLKNYTDANILKGKDNEKTEFTYYSIEYSYDEAFPKELIPEEFRKDKNKDEDQANSRRRRRR